MCSWTAGTSGHARPGPTQQMTDSIDTGQRRKGVAMGAESSHPAEAGSSTDETSGDYSYDLAHEEGAEPHPERSAGAVRRPAHGAEEAPPTPLDGDYSYDLAHEVTAATQ